MMVGVIVRIDVSVMIGVAVIIGAYSKVKVGGCSELTTAQTRFNTVGVGSSCHS
jgi:hypothetical protein